MRTILKFTALVAEFARGVINHRITLWSLWWLALGTTMFYCYEPALAGGGVLR